MTMSNQFNPIVLLWLQKILAIKILVNSLLILKLKLISSVIITSTNDQIDQHGNYSSKHVFLNFHLLRVSFTHPRITKCV